MSHNIPVLHAIQATFGDCLLLDFEGSDNKRRVWLIDGGPGNWRIAGTRKVANNSLFLTMNDEYLNIQNLDRVIVTHNDSDHTFGTWALITTLKNPDIAEVKDATLKPFLKRDFPIGNIWFNDAPLVAKFKDVSRASSYPGWMTNLLTRDFDAYTAGGIDIPSLNDEWGDEVVMIPTTGTFDNIAHILGPNKDNLDTVWKEGGVDATPPPGWIVNTMTQKTNSELPEPYKTASLTNWEKLAYVKKRGDTDTGTNYSSIMFEFSDTTASPPVRILMTGDGNGTDLASAYNIDVNDVGAMKEFSIVKLPHHGSCNNCMVSDGITPKEGANKRVPRFFHIFRAEKYVCSSDTLNSKPNPDDNMIHYMGDLFAAEQTHPAKAVYITNGMSPKSFVWFYYGSLSFTAFRKRNKDRKLMVLKKSDSVDYGTVVPSTDPLIVGDQEDNWVPITDGEKWYQRYVIEQAPYFYEMMKKFGSQSKTKIKGLAWDELLTVDAAAAAGATRIGTGAAKRAVKAASSALRRKKASTRIAALPRVDYNESKRLFLPKRLLKMAAISPAPTITPKISMNWHDVMVSNLIGRDDLFAEDLEDISLPVTIPVSQVIADGITQNWVDLPTYLTLLESDNAQLIPTNTQPKLNASYIPMLRYWFLTADQTLAETPILAAMLLNTFLNEEVAAELFIALPLSFNGASGFMVDPFAALNATPPATPTQTAMSSVTLQNFCASVIVPTAAQYASGSIFQHSGPLKVKMMYPTCQDALTMCSFNSNLKISTGTPTTLPVHGTMYATSGSYASYDIQFVGGLNAMDLLSIFACNSALATALLSNLSQTVQIPGVDMSAILNNSVQLEDAGIILRQHQPTMQAMAIEDMYGTVSTSSILQRVQLAGDFLGFFPASLQIPTNLPDITITASNITGPNSHKVALAFSQTVADLGTIAFQVAKGADNQTRFDIFAIPDANVHLKLQAFFTTALSDLYVNYAHLSFGPKIPYSTDSGHSLQQLTLAVMLDANIGLPNDHPMITLELVTLEILYNAAEENATSDMSVLGSAVVELGGYDATCTFRADHTADEIASFLNDDFTPPASASEDTSGGFQGLVYLEMAFPNDKPSIGAIIEGFLNDTDPGTGLNSLTQNIPTELFAILDSVEFQMLEMQIQHDATTGNKWQIAFFHLQVLLVELDDILNLLPGVTFSIPSLDIFIHSPSDPVNKAYQVALNANMSLGGGLCDVAARFDSPPPGFQSVPGEGIQVSLIAEPAHPGLPLGAIVLNFVGKALGDLDVNVQSLIPQQFQDAINSVTITQAMLGFLNTGTSAATHWELKLVEASVLSAATFTPIGNLSISNAQLHFSHDSGINAVPANVVPPTTQVQFDITLTVKTNVINAGFTYDSNSKGWTFTFKSGQTIDLTTLMRDGVDSLDLDLPSVIDNAINNVKIDTDSFYIAYSEGSSTIPESISFSNDSGTTGSVSVFGIGVSNISVFCTRPTAGGDWSYTVSLSLPTPCCPLAAFSPEISLLGNIQINNCRVAVAKGTPAPQVIGNAQIPKKMDSTSVILTGELVLGGSNAGAFMNLISSIISISEIDVCIMPNIFSIAIPPSSTGLSIMNVLIIQSFSLEFFEGGFGLGANVLLDTTHASWLSTTPISGSFLLQIYTDSAIGASAEISNITNPFSLPGVSLVDATFSISYLIEAETVQSISASASILLIGGTSPIGGSFALSMDQINPNNDYFKFNIVNLTLVDLASTMTHSPCPAFLKPARIGFRMLNVDLEISSIKFSFDADFYIFALEGQVHADVAIADGISLAANLNTVDILGLIQITEYQSNALGPFVYLDCTISTIEHMISGSTTGPPAWTGVTAATDPNLKGSVFALSATMVFLGAELDVYGIINLSGLQLTVNQARGLSLPDVTFSLDESFSITMNESDIIAGTTYHFNLSIDLPSFSLWGISVGPYDGTFVELDDALSVTVPYTVSDWHNIGADFYVMIIAEVLGVSIPHQKLELDITIKNLSQLPGVIEQYVKDQVVNYLENQILAPITQVEEDLKAAANKALSELQDNFNMLGADIICVLCEAGHAIEDIANALKNTLGYSIDEVAGALTGFGHDVNQISDIIGNVFLAAPQEVLSALISAGAAVEHAVDAVYNEAGAELSSDFNLVGNSVAGFALDAGKLWDIS